MPQAMMGENGQPGGIRERPLVSCLCVTEGRAAFMPWLLWSFDRQTWPHRELVIVDSSPHPFQSSRADVRVHHAEPGSNIPHKRNLALKHARGSIVAWFDDDDWQHPERLDHLVRALAGGTAMAGGTRSWFVDLHGNGCRSYDGEGAIIFNGAGFRHDLACAVPFDVARRRASDAVWMRAITARAGTGIARIDSVPLAMWLCHGQNISNPRTRGSYPIALDVLRQQLGDAWKESDQEIERLRLALPTPVAGPPVRPAHVFEGAGATAATTGAAAEAAGDNDGPWARDPRGRRMAHSRLRRAATPPIETIQYAGPRAQSERPQRRARASAVPPASTRAPTSFVIFATAADAGRAPVVIPHLIQQARHAFEEIVVVHDADSAANGADLRAALDKLASARVVDRLLASDAVIDDDASGIGCLRALSASVLGQALRTTTGEYVVVSAAHQLIHAAPGDSWVQQAIRALERAPDLILVEPHPGPHAGAPGTARSLGHHAAGRRWDAALGVWRSQTSVGQPFVARRERLLVALLSGDAPPGATLDSVLSSGVAPPACCGLLDTKGVWAVSLRGVGFAGAVTQLRDAIEAGLFPRSRAGCSELVIDDPAALRLWQDLRPIEPGSYEPGVDDQAQALASSVASAR